MRVFSILPPAACYLLAACAVFTTYHVYEGYFAEQKAMQQALMADVPEALPIDSFEGHTTEFGEVALMAQIRADWTQSLSVHGENGSTTSVFSFLVAPNASELGTEALGAIFVPAEKMDSFVAWLDVSAAGPSALGQTYEMNGRVIVPSGADAAMASLAEQGIRTSENFVFIEPFLNGREAALTPTPLDYKGYVVGGIVALLLAFLGYQRSLEDRTSRQPRVTSTEVLSKLSPMATGVADPDLDLVPPRVVSKADPDSPLGRIQARSQNDAPDW